MAQSYAHTFGQIIGGPVLKYEIAVRYSNGDKINAEFENKDDAMKFLNHYEK